MTEKLDHHVQSELCYTRPAYRQGRKFTAVKVYTVCNESKYLLIQGVPSVKLDQEMKKACEKYGKLVSAERLEDYPPLEQFTETWLVCYQFLASARHAKRFLDGKNFFGGILHVCYAPEKESVGDLRQKLKSRRDDVKRRLRRLANQATRPSD
ncbi:unnamed protein product [Notodromas monacha]|uniref:RNA-binding protein 48 n=1 Tax=Notodromas monacha TaxID=399045 RepID=A0A7R9BEK4_9CRUS|nr:unnamed protein product [Notodromas monacha]CAG0913947.1 unnamed protein product [Notodromas monacha]